MSGRSSTVTVVVAEAVSLAALLSVLLPPLSVSPITPFGIRFLAAVVLLVHAFGWYPPTRAASVVALLAAAAIWAVVHIEAGAGLRGAVLVGLALWACEEARDLSLTVRRPGQEVGPVFWRRLPRWLGVAAGGLGLDALAIAVLSDPPAHGWAWRVVGAAAVLVLLAVRRPRPVRGS